MSENVYIDQMNNVARRRKKIKDQLNRPEEDKLFTVRMIVGKIIGTKEKITICGMIPAYASSI